MNLGPYSELLSNKFKVNPQNLLQFALRKFSSNIETLILPAIPPDNDFKKILACSNLKQLSFGRSSPFIKDDIFGVAQALVIVPQRTYLPNLKQFVWPTNGRNNLIPFLEKTPNLETVVRFFTNKHSYSWFTTAL